jgi:ABC-2 type transport system permease protein
MTALNTRPPSTLALGLARASVELKTFFRVREVVVFTFSLPIIMLVILGSVFSEEISGTGITVSQLFAAGIVAGGVASTSFVNLGIGIATDRDDGTLKRLRGTPMPVLSYFLGKVLLVLVVSLVEVALLLGAGYLFFDLTVPTGLERWLTFGWVFLLGVTACSLLGVAAAAVVGSARGAVAFTNVALLVLQFASGVYVVPVSHLPEPLVQFGSLFPLKWMAQGFRSVFLPDAAVGLELAGAWEHARVALVLVAWCIGGLMLCLMTFRWRGRRES